MKTFWPGYSLPASTQRLPGGESHQRDGGGFFHADVVGLQRHVGFIHGNEFRECSDAMIARPRIDLVARLEPPDLGAILGVDPGDNVAQNVELTLRQYELELYVPGLGVEYVHSSCMNSNQDVVVPQLRFWHVG